MHTITIEVPETLDEFRTYFGADARAEKPTEPWRVYHFSGKVVKSWYLVNAYKRLFWMLQEELRFEK